jgi:hypothetical protein
MTLHLPLRNLTRWHRGVNPGIRGRMPASGHMRYGTVYDSVKQSICKNPLQNPTLGVLVTEGGNVLGRQTGLWSTETRCTEGCMALRWWQQCRKRSLWSTGQHPVVCMYAFHPQGSLWVVTVWFPGCETNMVHRKCTEKKGKGIKMSPIIQAFQLTAIFVGDAIWQPEPGSSVSIVSGYGRPRFDPRQGQRTFPLTSVSRPALGSTQPPVQRVPGFLSPGLKRGQGVTLNTHPHLVPRSRMSRSYTSSPSSAFMARSGTALALAIWQQKQRHTHPLWVCGFNWIQISSLMQTFFYGTKRLW